eukprot:1088449-Pelagomonas_calceolata.AAC.5
MDKKDKVANESTLSARKNQIREGIQEERQRFCLHTAAWQKDMKACFQWRKTEHKTRYVRWNSASRPTLG